MASRKEMLQFIKQYHAAKRHFFIADCAANPLLWTYHNSRPLYVTTIYDALEDAIAICEAQPINHFCTIGEGKDGQAIRIKTRFMGEWYGDEFNSQWCFIENWFVPVEKMGLGYKYAVQKPIGVK